METLTPQQRLLLVIMSSHHRGGINCKHSSNSNWFAVNSPFFTFLFHLVSSDLMGPNISFSVTHLFIYCSFSFVPIESPPPPGVHVKKLKMNLLEWFSYHYGLVWILIVRNTTEKWNKVIRMYGLTRFSGLKIKYICTKRHDQWPWFFQRHYYKINLVFCRVNAGKGALQLHLSCLWVCDWECMGCLCRVWMCLGLLCAYVFFSDE